MKLTHRVQLLLNSPATLQHSTSRVGHSPLSADDDPRAGTSIVEIPDRYRNFHNSGNSASPVLFIDQTTQQLLLPLLRLQTDTRTSKPANTTADRRPLYLRSADIKQLTLVIMSMKGKQTNIRNALRRETAHNK